MRAIDVGLPAGRVAFSTRLGGVSEGPYQSLNLGFLTDDDQSRTMANRATLADELGLRPERIAMGRQVHGGDIHEWRDEPDPSAYAEPRRAELLEVDGHATSLSGLAMIVLVADCLPVALIAPGRAAMLHCGWRPLAAGIVEKALATFSGNEPPAAAIGPGIGRCCYEVGEEVLAEFAGLDGVADGRMLDLRMVVRRKLEAAGISRIEDVDLCTSCRPDLFFSHRRDGGVTGRQGGLAWLT